MAWEEISNDSAPIDTIDDMSDKVNALIGNITSIQKKDNIVAKTGAFTLVKDVTFLVTSDANTADFTETLPAASTCSGQIFILLHLGSTGVCTVDAGSEVTINGNRYVYLVQQYACMGIISNGSNWYIIFTANGSSG